MNVTLRQTYPTTTIHHKRKHGMRSTWASGVSDDPTTTPSLQRHPAPMAGAAGIEPAQRGLEPHSPALEHSPLCLVFRRGINPPADSESTLKRTVTAGFWLAKKPACFSNEPAPLLPKKAGFLFVIMAGAAGIEPAQRGLEPHSPALEHSPLFFFHIC